MTLNCPICGQTCKNPNGASEKIQQHILSKHLLASYKCHECAHQCAWPKELDEHCVKEHQRNMTAEESSGELFDQSTRRNNLTKELEHYIPHDNELEKMTSGDLENASGVNSFNQLTTDAQPTGRLSLIILKTDGQKKSQCLQAKRTHDRTEGQSSENEEPEAKKQKVEEKVEEDDEEEFDDNEPEVPDKVVLEPVAPEQDSTPRTRRQMESPPNGRDKIECPFCRKTCIRRGIVQHVNYSHPDQYKRFRRSTAYSKILPLYCASCKMRFAGNESFRKHFKDTDCKRPDNSAEKQLSKEQEIKYKCPSGCNFFGPLRLMLTHMYSHPLANVKLRLRKSKILPVKCDECSFHYTTRSSLSKHIEKKRCIKNKEHVRYAQRKAEWRRQQKLRAEPEKEAKKEVEEKRVDIEVVKTNNTLFFRCPFDCDRLYTSTEKLTKHAEEVHAVTAAVEKEKPEGQVGSLVQSLHRTSDGKVQCPIGECRFTVAEDQYPRLPVHIRKNHTRYEYLMFRSTPTNEAPYVCHECNWSFTKAQITIHFQREGRSVCLRNKRWLDDLRKKEGKLPVLNIELKSLVPVDSSVKDSEATNQNAKTEADYDDNEEQKIDHGPLQQILEDSTHDDCKDKKISLQEDVPELSATEESLEKESHFVSDSSALAEKTVRERSEEPSLTLSVDIDEKADAGHNTGAEIKTNEKEPEVQAESESIETPEVLSASNDPTVDEINDGPLDESVVDCSSLECSINETEKAEQILNESVTSCDLIDVMDKDILEILDITLPDQKSHHPIIKVETTITDETEPTTVPEEDDSIEEIPLGDEVVDEFDDDDPIDQLILRSENSLSSKLPPVNFQRPREELYGILLRTLSHNPKPYRFECLSCDFSSPRLDDLHDHSKYAHSTSEFITFLARCRYYQHQCPRCGIRTNSKQWLAEHMKSDEKTCRKFSYYRTSFKIATDTQGSLVLLDDCQRPTQPCKRLYKCQECPKYFDKLIGGLLDHVAHAHDVRQYVQRRRDGMDGLKVNCDSCLWKFESVAAIEDHTKIECELFRTISAQEPAIPVINFQTGLRQDGPACPLCKEQRGNIFEVINHIARDHPDYSTFFRMRKSELLPYKCPSCSFYYPSLDVLHHHRKVGGECQRNLNERQKLAFSLELGGGSRLLNSSPNLTQNGRDSRLSYNSDQNDSAYNPSPGDMFQHYSPQPKKIFQQIQPPSISIPGPTAPMTQVAPVNNQMLQSQPFFPNQMPHQMMHYQQVVQMQKKPIHEQHFPVQNQYQHQFLTQPKPFVDMKDRYLVQVAQPNNYEPGVTSVCSYCFLPMKSKEDIQRHAQHPQECMLAAQTTLSKNILPCLYCGVQFSAPMYARLQQHIHHHHSHVYESFRRTISIALPFRCQKCSLCFNDLNVLQVHQKSGQC